MGWTRKSCRATLRHRRPDIEALEPRQLLTISHTHVAVHHGHAAVARLKTHPAPAASSQDDSATSASDIIGAAQTRSNYSVNGAGMTVAVIDTGVNYDNPALGGGEGPGYKVVTGYDFTSNSTDPMSNSTEHGTAVAGLIASSDSTDPGVAPGADIAALKVFGSTNQGNFTYVVEALQWVIANHSQYNVTAVNLSMSDGNNYAQNWYAQDGGVGQEITSLIGQLDTMNIPVVVAAGNSFTGQQGMGFPAIVSDAVSVTSTNAAGTELSSDAQRLSAAVGGASSTTIAAPGEGLTAPVQGSQFATVTGTSFAAAEVTGAVVLLQQIYESRFGQLPTVDQIDSWLQEGSDPVSDPVTNIAIGRLDISKAASLIPKPQAQVLAPAISQGVVDTGFSSLVANTTTSSPVSSDAAAAVTASSGGDVASSPAASSSQQPSASSTAPVSAATTALASISQATPTAPAQAVDTTATQSKVSTLLSGAFKSLSGWGGSASRIWSNVGTPQNTLGSSQPSGQISSLVHGTHHPRVHRKPK